MILWSPIAGSRYGTSAQKLSGRAAVVHRIEMPVDHRPPVPREREPAVAEQVVAAREDAVGACSRVSRAAGQREPTCVAQCRRLTQDRARTALVALQNALRRSSS